MQIRWRLTGRRALMFALPLWLMAVVYGSSLLVRYANTPGRLSAPPAEWPNASQIHPSSTRDTLVMFVHPQCPCTRTTIQELAGIMAVRPGKLDAFVLFYAPESEPANWFRTDTFRDAAAIPGVHALADSNGRELQRFGAATSGQTLLYDAQGRLTFNGGITIDRGHAGENDGSDAILALLDGESTTRHTTPVFGCSLLGGA